MIRGLLQKLAFLFEFQKRLKLHTNSFKFDKEEGR